MIRNPYQVLNVSQDANSADLVKAQALAMRNREYSPREIAEARAILSKPATRLAADFTFPIFPEIKKIQELKSIAQATDLVVDMLDENKYDSL